MPDDINEIIQILRAQENNDETESLEQLLYNLVLNPVKLKRQRIRLGQNMNDVVFELREGTIINESTGCLEEVEELVINSNTFSDGHAMNVYGITTCQTCGSTVHEESIRSCQCGRTCCTVPGCGRYSKSKDRWYCSGLHKFLGFFGVNLR